MHMDRLTSIDASFLAQEREGSHMHIGGVLLFEGPPPGREELSRHIESRLHLVPRYRQKLSFPRFEMGRPLWVDDPSFNIGYHVRHTALPAPGSVEQLRLLVGRIFSQRLDRSKPLWELWLVEGFEDGQFAIVNKTHHALVDGVSGADLTTVLFDLATDGHRGAAARARPGAPRPSPATPRWWRRASASWPRRPFGLARRALGAAASPGRTVARAREAAAGRRRGALERAEQRARDPAQRADRPASPADLGADPAGRAEGDQERARRHGQRRLPGHHRGRAAPLAARARRAHRGPGDPLRRAGLGRAPRATTRRLGNQITVMVGRLPTYADDPVERLRIVTESMKDLKESKQALGAEVIASIEDFAPPTIFARASRLHFSTRDYNLLTTNVPGPAVPAVPAGPGDAGAHPGRVPGTRPAPGGGMHELQRHRRAVADGRLRRACPTWRTWPAT